MVTGASSGIGEVTARAFAARGAKVVVTSNKGPDLEAVAHTITASGGCAIPIVADLSKADETSALIDRAEEAAGPVEVLINNAGVGMRGLVSERPMADTRFLFEVNFFAVAQLCADVVPRMALRGAGRIINVSSAAGQFGCANFSSYSASKGAVHAFTQALRVEARDQGIFVTEVVPISVRTPFFDHVRGKTYRPVGVVITPESVANSIIRCAQSKSPPPEVWPFRWIRLVFLLNALAPGLLVRINARSFDRAITEQRSIDTDR